MGVERLSPKFLHLRDGSLPPNLGVTVCISHREKTWKVTTEEIHEIFLWSNYARFFDFLSERRLSLSSQLTKRYSIPVIYKSEYVSEYPWVGRDCSNPSKRQLRPSNFSVWRESGGGVRVVVTYHFLVGFRFSVLLWLIYQLREKGLRKEVIQDFFVLLSFLRNVGRDRVRL